MTTPWPLGPGIAALPQPATNVNRRGPQSRAGLRQHCVSGAMIEDCGHFLAEERPEAVLDRLAAFLPRPVGR